MVNLRLLILLSCAATLIFSMVYAAADEEQNDEEVDEIEDWTEWFPTELAPFLALLGEKIALQYINQAMGWRRSLHMAVGAIGIATVFVSAIRVAGPYWSKRFVGKASENRAAAEAEILTSTSPEVAELFNGRQIVRVMGKGPIVQLMPVIGYQDGASMGMIDVQALTADNPYVRVSGRPLSSDTPRRGQSFCRAIVHDPSKTPNLFLNMRPSAVHFDHRWLILTITFQLGALIFAFLWTAHQTDDIARGNRGLALYTTGVFVVIFALLGLGRAIDGCTDETVCHPAKHFKMKPVWLQAAAVVNDQQFDSYAVFPKFMPESIISSERIDDMAFAFWKKALVVVCTPLSVVGLFLQVFGLHNLHKSVSLAQVIVTIAAASFRTFETPHLSKKPGCQKLMQGFELEWFTLTAAVNVTAAPWIVSDQNEARREESIFRWLKRHVGDLVSRTSSGGGGGGGGGDGAAAERDRSQDPLTRPWCQDSEGASWDWTVSAAQVGHGGGLVEAEDQQPGDQQPENQQPGDQQPGDQQPGDQQPGDHQQPGDQQPEDQQPGDIRPSLAQRWRRRLVRFRQQSGQPQEHELLDHPQHGRQPEGQQPENARPSYAQRAMVLRQRLGKNLEWRSPALTRTPMLAGAMEAVLNQLSECLPQAVGPYLWRSSVNGQPITFHCQRTEAGSWTVDATELDAWLSLTMFHARFLDQQNQRANVGERADLRHRPAIQLLDGWSRRLVQRLQWWAPSSLDRLCLVRSRQEPVGTTTSQTMSWRVVGSLSSRLMEMDAASEGRHAVPVHYNKRRFPCTEDDHADWLVAIESQSPPDELYARQLFSCFLWNVAETMIGTLSAGTSATLAVEGRSPGGNAGNARCFNVTLSAMATEIQKTGLMDRDDAMLSLLPPLLNQDKLQGDEAIAAAAMSQAAAYEQSGAYDKAGDTYVGMFDNSTRFGGPSLLGDTARLLSLLVATGDRRKLVAVQLLTERDMSQEDALIERLVRELSKADGRSLLGLLELPQFHHRVLMSANSSDSEGSGRSPAPAMSEFLRDLGLNLQRQPPGHQGEPSLSEAERLSLGMTELHRESVSLEDLAAASMDDITRADALGWTPLHYAAYSGSRESAQALVRRGVAANTTDVRGRTPLHLACMGGHRLILRALHPHVDFEQSPEDLLGLTPIHWAACKGHEDVTFSLHGRGTKVNTQGIFGMAPIHWAAFGHHPATVKRLQDLDSKLMSDANGRTPIHQAALRDFGSNSEKLSGLIDTTTADDIFCSRDKQGYTALHLAAKAKCFNMVEALLRLESTLAKEADFFGQTPLYFTDGVDRERYLSISRKYEKKPASSTKD